MYTITITKDGIVKSTARDSLISGDMTWYSTLPCGKNKPSIRAINDAVSLTGVFETQCGSTDIKVVRNGSEV